MPQLRALRRVPPATAAACRRLPCRPHRLQDLRRGGAVHLLHQPRHPRCRHQRQQMCAEARWRLAAGQLSSCPAPSNQGPGGVHQSTRRPSLPLLPRVTANITLPSLFLPSCCALGPQMCSHCFSSTHGALPASLSQKPARVVCDSCKSFSWCAHEQARMIQLNPTGDQGPAGVAPNSPLTAGPPAGGVGGSWSRKSWLMAK